MKYVQGPVTTEIIAPDQTTNCLSTLSSTALPLRFGVARVQDRCCCGGWGGFSPLPPSSHCLRVPRDPADWHPDCQADDGSYHENQK
ncbi:hypothetical protein ILYODFUR_002404 [Ilyodon furcidens]|uniref:Uncharacterized protein n=1 Tax=Ilyodon furcidens TaxID=33524 RepID=A0ABV0UEG4_9TELE